MNCRRVVAAVGAACVAGSVLALPAAAQEGSDPPAEVAPPDAPVGDLPAGDTPLLESRTTTTRPPAVVVEEPVPAVPETTVAPLPAMPPPSYPMGRVMRSAVEVEVEDHMHDMDEVHAEAPVTPTRNGNQSVEAVLVVVTVSLLVCAFWSCRKPA